MIAATQHELLREAAGLVARPGRGKLRLEGAEAAEFLQGQVSNDVEALVPGAGCYAALLDHKGKIRTDLRVVRLPDSFLLDTEPAGLLPLVKTVRTFSLGRAVTFHDETTALAVLSLIGPGSAGALEVAPPGPEHSNVEGRHGLYVRTDLGIDVICPAEEAAATAEALGVETVPEEAAECRRIETGRPRFGLDIGADVIPQEAGLNERAVSFTKGCYVGQETVARLFYRGKPNRRLRGLRLSAPAEPGAQLVLGERTVGTLGSTCDSPLFGPIALAIVRREAEDGAVVAVGESGVTGEVVELPFERTV